MGCPRDRSPDTSPSSGFVGFAGRLLLAVWYAPQTGSGPNHGHRRLADIEFVAGASPAAINPLLGHDRQLRVAGTAARG